LMAASLLPAAEVGGTIPGQVLAGGSNRLFLLDPSGAVVWQHPAGLVHDAWMLPGGNILYADGKSVTEVTADHKVVFEYKAETRDGVYACQRLRGGRTLVAENSTGRILEVDAAGKVVFQLQTSPYTPGHHHNLRMARKLANGDYLVCHSGARLVKEYAPEGAVKLEIRTPNTAFAALRTEAGTTLVSSIDQVMEYDGAGNIVWQFKTTDIPGVTIRNMTGIHLLPNGNLAIGCYSAYQGGGGTGLLEITRDRALVWRYADPAADRSLMAIQRLDPKGRPLPGPIHR
jgi:hypothetical protein